LHLIRNSLAFVSWKDRKAILPALKAIYRAENADVALVRLEEFEAEWSKRYPAIGAAWRRAWEHVIPFFAFAPGIRKMIYTTDEMDKRYFVKCVLLFDRAAGVLPSRPSFRWPLRAGAVKAGSRIARPPKGLALMAPSTAACLFV
jgi:transposase-like protein